MKVAYPVHLTPQPDGSVLVRFPDVPEALTDGDSLHDARVQAVDCLVAALGGYVQEGREIPQASHPEPDEATIVLPSLIAAKLELYQAMRAARLSAGGLGARLGQGETAARRLLDLDHRSHLEQIEEALAVLGKRLIVEVHDAA